MKLVSWNVNGLRSVLGKGLLDYINQHQPDVLCLQEIKANLGDIAHVTWPAGYTLTVNSAQKKGYSGTALLTRQTPVSIVAGIHSEEHDCEGRALTAEFPDFYLINTYVPNAQPELARIAYRQRWDARLFAYMQNLERTKPVILCGDLNVAHEPIDLARPKENIGNPGFSDEEREGFRAYLAAHFIDTFRHFEPGPHHYSWWTYRAGAREKNVGWRIDYFLTSAKLKPKLKRAWISPEVHGSDHCPVGLELTP
jgi:exodeoxyribonuclease-3